MQFEERASYYAEGVKGKLDFCCYKCRSRTTNTIFKSEEEEKSLDKQTHRNIVELVLLVVYLLCFAAAAGLFYILAPVTKRGFFCSDMEIMQEFKGGKETVPSRVAFSISLLILTVSLLGTDLMNYFEYKKVRLEDELQHVQKHVKILQTFWTIKSYLVGILALGISLFIIVIGKKLVGALRPDFLQVCFGKHYEHPCRSLSLSKPAEFPFYVAPENVACVSENAHMIEDERMSFPSGHTALAMAPAIYSLLYINYQLKNATARYASIAWQLLVILLSWFVSVSRIADNKHHYRDVASAAVISLAVSTVLFFFLHRTKRIEDQLQEQTTVRIV